MHAPQRVADVFGQLVDVTAGRGEDGSNALASHTVSVFHPPVVLLLVSVENLLRNPVDVAERDRLEILEDVETPTRVQVRRRDLVEHEVQHFLVPQPVGAHHRICGNTSLRHPPRVLERFRRRHDVLDRNAMTNRGEDGVDVGRDGVLLQFEQLRILAELGDLGQQDLLDRLRDVVELAVEGSDDLRRACDDSTLVDASFWHETTVDHRAPKLLQIGLCRRTTTTLRKHLESWSSRDVDQNRPSE